MSKTTHSSSLTHTIAGNTVWYGLEVGLSIAATLLTSVPIARVIGPEKLSYFNYIQWLANVSGLLATVGIPATTRKYVAEFLGKGEHAVVWAIVRRTFWLQSMLAILLLALGSGAAYFLAQTEYRLIAFLLVITVAVRLLAYIPSSANTGAENLRANFLGALTNFIPQVILINLSLLMGWGLTGVAATFALCITLELAAKLFMMFRWLKPVPRAVLPGELERRMTRFSRQGLVLMGIQITVWDRSDLLFLKWLDHDVKQVTFFALAFNLAEKLLMLPQAFSQVMGTSLMAEHGRNRERLNRITSSVAKYAFLLSAPVMAGLAAISGPVVRVLYGDQYLPVIPVLAIGGALAAVKPLLAPVQNVMQAEDRQDFLIRWGLFCAALNIGMDCLFIPWAGARGAMLANGAAQGIAILGVWIKAKSSLKLEIDLTVLGKIALSSSVMAGVAWFVQRANIADGWRLLAAVPLAAITYILMLKFTGVMDAQDGERLRVVSTRFPAALRPMIHKLTLWLCSAPALPIAGQS